MNHLSQKKIYSLAYQWIMAKEADGITDEESAELANAVIGFLWFVRQAKPPKRGSVSTDTAGKSPTEPRRVPEARTHSRPSPDSRTD